jgi:hypothetical protein
VTDAKCVFWNIIVLFICECCAAVHNLSDPICEGSFQLRSKPLTHCVLNSVAAAAECLHALVWSKRTNTTGQQTSALLVNHRLQMFNNSWPQKMDDRSLLYNSAIQKECHCKQTQHWLKSDTDSLQQCQMSSYWDYWQLLQRINCRLSTGNSLYFLIHLHMQMSLVCAFFPSFLASLIGRLLCPLWGR